MIPDHLLVWARLAGPERLLVALRERAETRRLGPRAVVDLPFDAEERHAIGQLLEASWQRSEEPVRVARLRAGLAEHGVVLEDLLQRVGGPLRDLPTERAEKRGSVAADREAGRALLAALVPGSDLEHLDRCLRGAPSWESRAQEISRVLWALDAPAAPGMPGRPGQQGQQGKRLPVLAAEIFGDAHALDRSRPLGRGVARLLAGPDGPDPMGGSAAWRDAWASRGVACDEVSSMVLVLNLPLVGDAAAVSLSALRGEPVWLTLRSLRGSFSLAGGVGEVFVCENPSVVEAAADSLGVSSRPLVCTFGVPGLAARTLLEGIAAQTSLQVRADEDPAGRRIVAELLGLPGAQPWRLDGVGTRYEEELLDLLLADVGQPDRQLSEGRVLE